MSYGRIAPHTDGTTDDRLLTPGEVAALFRVDPKTVTRWAAAGRIGSIRTPGGHRRFRESEIRTLLEGQPSLPNQMRSDPHPVPLPADEMGGDNRTVAEPDPQLAVPAPARADDPLTHRMARDSGIPQTPTTDSTVTITPAPGTTRTQMADLTHPSHGLPCTPCGGPCLIPTPDTH